MTSLRRSPKVMQLGAVLRCDRLKAFGAAVDWFCWLDEQCADGCTYLAPKQVDEVLGIKRMSDALVAVGWARVGSDGLVYVVDFDQHNGESAKSRAQSAKRQERFKSNAESVTKSNAESVTETSANALPRIYSNNIDTKGVLSTTVDIEAGACPSAPHAGFGEWLRVLGPAVPMLRRLNLDKPLPRVVEAEARKAAELVPMTAETVEMIRRFYEAEEVQGYRPDSLEWFFRDLPDVLQHASNFCRVDDRRRRKEAATARRRVMEREQCQNGRTGASGAFIRSQDEADRNMELWREVCEEDEHA